MRIAFNIAIVVSLLFLPWWLTALVALCAVSLVGKFYEAILYGILFDALYGAEIGFYGFSYAATLYTTVIALFANAIRSRVVR